jgi:uncharacterized protein (TIGR02145 family)
MFKTTNRTNNCVSEAIVHGGSVGIPKYCEVAMRTRLDQFILSILAACLLVLSAGCGGDDKSTNPDHKTVPVVTTAAVDAVTETTAQCGGTVTSDGGAAVTARGVCWSTGQSPTIADSKTIDGSGTGSFTSSITDLSADTEYHVRAYATNSVGTGYGVSRPFQTESSGTGTVTDVDGNVYKTVRIGTEWWMAENLRVTHYRNGGGIQMAMTGGQPWMAGNPIATHHPYGDEIPLVTDNAAWSTLTTGAYCIYDNNESNAEIYGNLYNWYAVADSRGIAPVGWHVPIDAEWQILVDIVGGDLIAGGALKEAGTAHWIDPNTGTNEFGFTALPGGYRLINGTYRGIGTNTLFWSCTEDPDAFMPFAWYRSLFNSSSSILRLSDSKNIGMSVRCVRD